MLRRKITAWRDVIRTSRYRDQVQNLTPAPALTDKPESAPWMVTIQYDAPSHGRFGWHLAAGVLIAPNLVLTCAHSFSQAAQRPGTIPQTARRYSVRTGGTTLDDGTLHEIIAVIPHPHFNVRTGAHDVAIAVVAPGTEAAPLCLDPMPAKVGDSVVVPGWPDGRDGDGRLTRVRTTIVDPRIGGGNGMLCLANLAEPHNLRASYSGGPVISLRDDVPRACGVLHAGVQGVRVDGFGVPALAVDLAKEFAFVEAVRRDFPRSELRPLISGRRDDEYR